MLGFEDIVGQDALKDHMQNAMRSGKISHAYIINGDNGSGKEFIARIFAKALLCEGEGKKPCNKCRSCIQMQTENQPDFIKISAKDDDANKKDSEDSKEKSKSIGVDAIRQLNDGIQIKPYSSRYKIYMIVNAEKMTVQAQNALLKTLEEPPSYAIIMLLTANVNAFLPTILSRCVVLNLRPIPDELVNKYLMEKMQIPDYKAKICTAFARGNIGKAMDLAGNENFDRVKSEAVALLKYVQDMELYEIVAAIRKITEYKLDVNEYLDIIMVWYRDVLLFKATNNINNLIFKEEISAIRKVAARSSYEGIEKVIDALDKAKKRLEANVNFDLCMELLVLAIKENG